MTACLRPVSASVKNVEYTVMTLFGPVVLPQGRRIVFTYEDGTNTFLADATAEGEFSHAQVN